MNDAGAIVGLAGVSLVHVERVAVGGECGECLDILGGDVAFELRLQAGPQIGGGENARLIHEWTGSPDNRQSTRMKPTLRIPRVRTPRRTLRIWRTAT